MKSKKTPSLILVAAAPDAPGRAANGSVATMAVWRITNDYRFKESEFHID
jgi:hypothetical protein